MFSLDLRCNFFQIFPETTADLNNTVQEAKKESNMSEPSEAKNAITLNKDWRNEKMAMSSLTGSVKMQALAIRVDSTRSIGGRLGGHFDSSRSIDRSRLFGSGGPPTEGTRLVSIPSIDVEEDKEQGGPPLSKWIAPALCCAAAYAFYNIFIKKGSATINPILGGVILQFVAALLGTILLAFLTLGSDDTFKLHYDRDGLFWSIMAGLAVGLAEMLSFCVSGLGVPATQSIPIIIGGSVMFGAVLGLVLLGEKLMLHGWSGVALLVAGIALVALDPGEKIEEGGSQGEGDSAARTADSGPPMYWIAIALVCASAYAFYNIFIKKGSASINPILGGVVLQFVAALFGSVLLGVILILDGGTAGLAYDHAGLFWSIMAGIAVGAAELLSFTVSGLGVQATQSIPVIIGGSVLFGAILGLLLLGETMMVPGWTGIALLTTGIGIVATDPGEKVAPVH